MIFPRWTGTKGRNSPTILTGKSSLIRYVEANNGYRPVTVSVHAFDRFRSNKPFIQSAIVENLYLTTTPELGLEYSRMLTDADIKHQPRYDGNVIDILVALDGVYTYPDNPLHEVARRCREVIDIPFSSHAFHLMLWHRTWNPKTKRYVIGVLPTQEISEIDELANKPIKVKPIGSKYIDIT